MPKTKNGNSRRFRDLDAILAYLDELAGQLEKGEIDSKTAETLMKLANAARLAFDSQRQEKRLLTPQNPAALGSQKPAAKVARSSEGPFRPKIVAGGGS